MCKLNNVRAVNCSETGLYFDLHKKRISSVSNLVDRGIPTSVSMHYSDRKGMIAWVSHGIERLVFEPE